MGHSPELNPTKSLAQNGKLKRYVTNTTCVRALRFDREAEAAFVRAREILSRPSPDGAHNPLDSPSFSLIVRRSLRWYAERLALAASGVVERERQLVREASHLPRNKSLSK